MKCSSLATWLLVPALCLLPALQARADTPPSIEDFVKHATYKGVKISPTGEYLAIGVEHGDERGEAEGIGQFAEFGQRGLLQRACGAAAERGEPRAEPDEPRVVAQHEAVRLERAQHPIGVRAVHAELFGELRDGDRRGRLGEHFEGAQPAVECLRTG